MKKVRKLTLRAETLRLLEASLAGAAGALSTRICEPRSTIGTCLLGSCGDLSCGAWACSIA